MFSLFNKQVNNIASQRIEGFRKHLGACGHDIQVISRFYSRELRDGAFGNVSAMPNSAEQRVGNFGEKDYLLLEFPEMNSEDKWRMKLPFKLGGLYGYSQFDLYHKEWGELAFEHFCRIHRDRPFETVILSYGPPIVLKLAAQIKKQFPEIKIIVDFRDLYFNEQDKGIHLYAKLLNLRRIKRFVDAWIFVSEGMQEYFLKQISVPSNQCIVVHNGLEDDAKFPSESDESDKDIIAEFKSIQESSTGVLLHSGTLYPGQDIDFFIRGIREYNQSHSTNWKIVLLGLADHVNEFEVSDDVKTLGRVSHRSSLHLMKEANGLILPVWKDRYTGWSGKTYEYLASNNLVLVGRDAQPDLKQYLAQCPNAFQFAKIESFESQFERGLLEKWSPINHHFLRRSYWVRQLNDFICEL